MKGDVNVINMDTIGLERPRMVNDLPLGARRWVQDYWDLRIIWAVVASRGYFEFPTPEMCRDSGTGLPSDAFCFGSSCVPAYNFVLDRVSQSQ